MKYKTSELRKQPDGIFILPTLTAGIDNQGLNNYVPIEGATILQNVISISANGANTGVTFFQSKKFTILQDAYAIDWKNNSRIFTRHSGVFIASVINSVLHGKYEWTNKANWTKVKEEYITLPTTNKDIDFDFMESFIAELEAERIAELSAYLKVSGLDNYELSDEELKALRDYDSMEWREYKLGELFEVKTYKKRFDANKVTLVSKGGSPYVVRKSTENGIKGFISEDDSYLNEGNTISFGQDTATSFYQEQPYFTGDKIKILKAKFNGFNKENAQFFVSAITRSFSKFSWGSSSYSVDIISNQKLALPVLNNEIAIKYIEVISKAISKLTIKDVVQYTDKRIEATKTVVAEHQKEESV